MDNENTSANSDAKEKDTIKDVIQAKLEEISTQNLLLGAQTMCKVILEEMYLAKNKQGKLSYRDYERLMNKIEDFCVTGLSRQIEPNETAPTTNET